LLLITVYVCGPLSGVVYAFGSGELVLTDESELEDYIAPPIAPTSTGGKPSEVDSNWSRYIVDACSFVRSV
jgi:hypothetical protein